MKNQNKNLNQTWNFCFRDALIDLISIGVGGFSAGLMQNSNSFPLSKPYREGNYQIIVNNNTICAAHCFQEKNQSAFGTLFNLDYKEAREKNI